jgi:hypothetical protein
MLPLARVHSVQLSANDVTYKKLITFIIRVDSPACLSPIFRFKNEFIQILIIGIFKFAETRYFIDITYD